VLDPLLQVSIGVHSATMRSAMEALRAAARTDAPIVLRAELGCEISELARFAHEQSERRAGPFLALACSSLTQLPVHNLSASVRGTIFLRAIGDLAEPLQAKLVHLLDALETRGPPPRLICSTQRDLDTEVDEGRLRQDLLYRLNVVDIRIPPLRERREDILPAARAFIALLSADLGRPPPSLSADAAVWLERHPFPGNVRELRNLLERALLGSCGEVLEVEALADPGAGDLRPGADVTLRELETEHVSRVLSRVGSLKKAATILGIDASTLWRRRQRDDSGAEDPSKPR
jgi:NtrC-family two-component system response regulator AlgB